LASLLLQSRCCRAAAVADPLLLQSRCCRAAAVAEPLLLQSRCCRAAAVAEPLLLQSRRITSSLHRFAHCHSAHCILRADDCRQGQYQHTKLANVLFTYEMQRRMGSKGVQCCAADPGGVKTEIWGHHWILRSPPVSMYVNTFFAPPEDGAKSIEYAATADWVTSRWVVEPWNPGLSCR
jgi:NAD(P)-dependent dehydrogenase (short-subunit alcohol dehydrogenase family)